LWTDCCVHYIWNKHCISWSIDDSSERVRSVSVGKGLWQIHEILHPNRRSVPLWLCSVHLDGSDIHHLSLQSVQDVFPKVVPAFEEHVMIITVIVIVSIFFFVFWKLFFFLIQCILESFQHEAKIYMTKLCEENLGEFVVRCFYVGVFSFSFASWVFPVCIIFLLSFTR